jgi:quercetin dioxygenase-like cupin family protein
VPAVRFAEWDADGTVRIVMDDEADRAPPTASRYESKTYGWGTGSIRTLTFKKQPGGVVHQITFETEIYVLQGSVEVGLAGKPVKLDAGDAISLPSGVMRNPKPRGDTVVLLFAVGSAAKDAKPKVVRLRDTEAIPSASWTRDGKAVTARAPEDVKKAPPGAARWSTRRYEFDGNSIRVATFRKGGSTGTGVTQTDALIYVAKGRIGRTEGPESAVLAAGDAVREQAGLAGHWDAVDEATFIATSAPFPGGQTRVKP